MNYAKFYVISDFIICDPRHERSASQDFVFVLAIFFSLYYKIKSIITRRIRIIKHVNNKSIKKKITFIVFITNFEVKNKIILIKRDTFLKHFITNFNVINNPPII